MWIRQKLLEMVVLQAPVFQAAVGNILQMENPQKDRQLI